LAVGAIQGVATPTDSHVLGSRPMAVKRLGSPFRDQKRGRLCPFPEEFRLRRSPVRLGMFLACHGRPDPIEAATPW